MLFFVISITFCVFLIIPRDELWAQKWKFIYLVWITWHHIVHTRKVLSGYVDEQSVPSVDVLGYIDFTFRYKECQRSNIMQRMSRYGFSSLKPWRMLRYCRPTLRYRSSVKPRVRVNVRVCVISGCFLVYSLRNASLPGEYHLSVNILCRNRNEGLGWGGGIEGIAKFDHLAISAKLAISKNSEKYYQIIDICIEYCVDLTMLKV